MVESDNRLFSPAALRKLIIPLILEQALLITVGIADTVMVAAVGEAAVSGVSLVDMLNNLIISVLAALATGGAVVTSQLIGAGKREAACDSARQLLVVTTLITLVVSVVVAVFGKEILNAVYGGIEQEVFENAWLYLMVSAAYFPFLAVYNSAAALFRSMGNAGITLKVSLWMNLLNICGNAICIYGLKMGVLGAAIPTLFSRVFAACVLYVLLKNPKNMIYLRRERFSFQWDMVRKILYIGIPGGIENGIFQLGRVIVVSIISGFGTVQIAANGVANSLDNVGSIIGLSMGLAMITVIGQCVGAGSTEQVKYYTGKLMKKAYLYTALLNIPVLLLLPFLLKLYALSPETMELSYQLVMIHNGMALFLWPAAFTMSNMLRACNDVRYTMVVSIFSMFAFRIGLSYLIGVHMGCGAIGVWIAMVVDWIFRAICFVGRFLAGSWKKTAALE